MKKRHSGYIENGSLITLFDIVVGDNPKVKKILVKKDGKPFRLIRFFMVPGSPMAGGHYVNCGNEYVIQVKIKRVASLPDITPTFTTKANIHSQININRL